MTPTLLDLLGVPLPSHVNGVEQIPLHGTSMAHTLNDNDADTRKTIQYFETIGQRALWHRGWKAVTFHHRGTSFDDDVWELYHLDVDLAEIDNLAEQHPEKLKGLIDLWWREAERYGVLPLDDLTGRRGVGWWPEPKNRWVLYQDAVLPHFFKAGPRVRGVSHRITARIERGSTNAEGAIIADGGRFGGWSVFILGNRLHYTTNNFGERCRVSSPVAIPPGAVTLRADVVRTGTDDGRVRFYIDDQPAGEGVLTPFRYHNFVNEPLDVGPRQPNAGGRGLRIPVRLRRSDRQRRDRSVRHGSPRPGDAARRVDGHPIAGRANGTRRTIRRRDRTHRGPVQGVLDFETVRTQTTSQHRHDRSGRRRLFATRLLRLGHRNPGPGQPGRRWPALCQLPRHAAVLADPDLSPDGTQSPQRGHEPGRGDDQRVPQHAGLRVERGGQPRRDAASPRLSDPGFRQVALGLHQRDEPGRLLRPLAAAARLRPVLRLPGWRDQPVESGVDPRQRAHRTAGRRLPPVGRHRRQRQQVAAATGVGSARQTVLPVRRLRGRTLSPPCAAGLRRQVPGQVRRRLGRRPNSSPRPAESFRANALGPTPRAAQSRCASVG